MEYLENLLAFLIPAPKFLSILLWAILIGSFGSFSTLFLGNYIRHGNEIGNVFKIDSKAHFITYCIIGGVCAAIAQGIQSSDQFLALQSFTMGVAWPSFVDRLRRSHSLKGFIDGGDDVPLKEK